MNPFIEALAKALEKPAPHGENAVTDEVERGANVPKGIFTHIETTSVRQQVHNLLERLRMGDNQLWSKLLFHAAVESEQSFRRLQAISPFRSFKINHIQFTTTAVNGCDGDFRYLLGIGETLLMS